MRRTTREHALSLLQPAPSVLRRARVAIIRAEYNREITLSLEEMCAKTLHQGGVPAKNIKIINVPGCFELPLVAQRLAAGRRFHVLIALGAVIRGETYHFDLVATQCAKGIMEVSLKYDIPIIFEVLATYNRRDALRRAGNNNLNKGMEAAKSALSMLQTLNDLKK